MLQLVSVKVGQGQLVFLSVMISQHWSRRISDACSPAKANAPAARFQAEDWPHQARNTPLFPRAREGLTEVL